MSFTDDELVMMEDIRRVVLKNIAPVKLDDDLSRRIARITFVVWTMAYKKGFTDGYKDGFKEGRFGKLGRLEIEGE